MVYTAFAYDEATHYQIEVFKFIPSSGIQRCPLPGGNAHAREAWVEPRGQHAAL